MQLRIERLPRARSDELDIWLHIASDNLSAADGLLDQIDRAINMLAVYPNAGRARAELGNDLRSYPIAAYAVFYHHDAELLTVVRILSSYRDISADHFE